MLSIGIVGLPNVGKSTLFKALTKKQIDIQNYAFTTIEPSVGIVAVPDKRLEALTKLSGSAKTIPTAIEFVDIAGLVKGASEGEGLGNQFLANIREVDAIAHVVRVFDDGDITHILNKIDPVDDIGIIELELELADEQSKANRAKKEKTNKSLPPLQLLTDKPIIYVLNVSEQQLKNGWKPSDELLKTILISRPISSKIRMVPYVVMSNTFELLLSEASQEEQQMYLEDIGLKESGLDSLIKQAYETLGLLTFLTTGHDETRAWTAHIGDLIPKAVGAIHTDFTKQFIRADVINWQELIDTGGWSRAREAGKLRTVGKDYVIQEGDVVEVKI